MIIKAVSYTPGREATKTSCIYFFILEDKGKSHWIGGDIDSQ